MRIGIINASSVSDKNPLLCGAVRRFAPGHEVVDLGCHPGEAEKYSYLEIAVLAGLLLGSRTVDFIVTGCSSGQGMMLACNSVPGVLCGYAPAPRDAYLFAQINNGNAVSLPLGDGYTYAGPENLESTVESLFREPFGQGWPKEDAERKLADTRRLVRLRAASQTSPEEWLKRIDADLIGKALTKRNAVDEILSHGDPDAAALIRRLLT